MANTNLLVTEVEPYVREWLGEKFGTTFERRDLPLEGCEAEQSFDAVSADKKIVACIRFSSGLTSGGKFPTGKRDAALRDLYFLLLVKAEKKLMVLTDREFFELFSDRKRFKIHSSIEVVHCELPADLENIVKSIRREATDEIDMGKGAGA
jgi:hypothetical protein